MGLRVGGGTHLVGHEGGDGAPDLMVVHVGAAGPQQHKEEAHGDGHLQHRVQLHRLLQPHEGHGGLVQELHATCGAQRSARGTTGCPAHGHPPPHHRSVPTSTTVASALSGIFSSSFSSCLDLERVMPAGGAGVGTSRCGHRVSTARMRSGSGGKEGGGGRAAHLPLHIHARVVLSAVPGNEGLGDGRLPALTHVVGAVVVHQQRAQAAG